MKKSILTEHMYVSILSGKRAECTHELIFGSGCRKKSIQEGLVIPLTNEEHNMAARIADRIHDNPRAEDLSKIAGQLAWEKEFYRKKAEPGGQDPARAEFMMLFGRSYL